MATLDTLVEPLIQQLMLTVQCRAQEPDGGAFSYLTLFRRWFCSF